jgi:hypothetical protein
MPRTALVALVLSLAGCAQDTTASSEGDTALRATAVTQSVRFPLDQTVFVPCAAGGAGENVRLSGTLHDLFMITGNDAGHFSVKVLDNPQGAVGSGELTGIKYQGTGATGSVVSLRVGESSSAINTFRIVGPGPGNNLLIQEHLHLTINANGVVTANLVRLIEACS